jgi:hypothetical protein
MCLIEVYWFAAAPSSFAPSRKILVKIDLLSSRSISASAKKKCGALQIRSWVGFPADSIAASQKKKEEGNRAGRGLANARLPRSPMCGARDPPQRIDPIDLKLQLAAVGCSIGQVLRGPAHRPGSLANQHEEPALPKIAQGLPRPARPSTEIVWGRASLVSPPPLARFLCHSLCALDSLLGLFSLQDLIDPRSDCSLPRLWLGAR